MASRQYVAALEELHQAARDVIGQAREAGGGRRILAERYLERLRQMVVRVDEILERERFSRYGRPRRPSGSGERGEKKTPAGTTRLSDFP